MTHICTRLSISTLILAASYTPMLGALTGTAAFAQTTQNTTTTFVYDTNGKPKQVIDPRQRTTDLKYDSLNRLKETTQPPPATGLARPVTGYTYDGLDQLVSVKDPRNLVTSYSPDGKGDQIALASPDTNTTTRTFDEAGNVKTVTDARNKTTRYDYDELNRLVAERFATGVPNTFEYDGTSPGGVGKLTKFTDESGQTVFAFDDHGRLTTKTQTTGATVLVTRYTYGTVGTGLGKVASITYPSGNRINYTYDVRGNVSGLTLNRGLPGGATDLATSTPLLRNVSYAANGAVTGWEWGNHTTANPSRNARTYDLDGRVSSFSLGNAAGLPLDVTSSVTVKLSTFTYDATTKRSSGTVTLTNTTNATTSSLEVLFKNLPAGVTLLSPVGTRNGAPYRLVTPIAPNAQSVLAVQFQNSSNVAVTFQNQILSRASVGMTRTLTYDAAGQILKMTHTGGDATPAIDQTFTYDDLGRLTSFTGNVNSHKYEYDATGNRTKLTIGSNGYAVTTSPTSNKLMSTAGPAPAKTVSYDAGYVISDGSTTYTYSDRGRMKRAVKAAVTTDYLYNALGQRVAKSGNVVVGGTNYNVYDEAGHQTGEYRGTGAVLEETVYLGDMPVAVLAGDVYYVYSDHLNTARVVTTSSDNVPVWRWDKSDPFGGLQPIESPYGRAAFTYNPRFPGQLYDKETGNHYNYFRDYDPQLGRYIQSDPIGLLGGIDPYAYVANAPVTGVDALGLSQDDARYIMRQVRGAFPDIKPSGDVYTGEIQSGNLGETDFSGNIYIPLNFNARKCLSYEEWERLFYTLFHEGMHSSDGYWTRMTTSNSDSDAHHQSIYRRETYERMRPKGQGLDGLWGTPSATAYDDKAGYEQYRKNSPDCKCQK